jgi:hypothetical protein
MIQLCITMTGKSFSPKDKFSRFGEETKNFSTIKEAKGWLKEQYGNSKRVPMYVDLKTGGTKRTGYVIGFRNADYSHSPVQKWIQQDWVEFREVTTINPNKG